MITILLIVYLPNILHHDWHPKSVSLVYNYIRHQLCALLAWRTITSLCCGFKYHWHVCYPCRETSPLLTSLQSTCSFRHTIPQTRHLWESCTNGTLPEGLLVSPPILARSEKRQKVRLGFELKSRIFVYV